jgi:tRNA A37 threonylcarbamoyltransferase TsaD
VGHFQGAIPRLTNHDFDNNMQKLLKNLLKDAALSLNFGL